MGSPKDNSIFELCCIPFFLYDLALADIVETDDRYTIRKVIEPSGRFVFRIWFGDSFQPRAALEEELKPIGAEVEWSSVNLRAVDAIDRSLAKRVADQLMDLDCLGLITYETGRTLSE